MPIMFKADLIHTKLGTTSQIEELKSDILNFKNSSDENITLSNPGCWRSKNFSLEKYEWLIEGLKSLVAKAHYQYIEEDHVYKEYAKLDGSILNHWVNVNDPGSRNVMHSHYSTYSAVYYIQVDGTGSLRFCNPALTLSNDLTDSPYSRDFYVAPKEGDLLLWPSWVPHEVEPNLTNKQRINIAFDIHLKNDGL